MPKITADNPYGLPELEKGVYRDESTWPGVIEYRIIDSYGRVMLRVEVAETYDSEDLQRRFWRWLERYDKKERLRAI